MKRLHLVELEDLPWCPAAIRDGATAYLRAVLEVFGIHRFLVPVVRDALARTGVGRVIDLCSGGGGPWPRLSGAVDVPVTLTDKFPNVGALRHASARAAGELRVVESPTDATRVPRELRGLRTLFNSFHHFRPDAARSILEAAVRDRQPILVVEMAQRNVLTMLAMVAQFPVVPLLFLTHVRPVRLDWILWTFVVPLIPAMVVFDGIVSCWRVYTPEELGRLTDGLDDFEWEIERIPIGVPGSVGTTLLGVPRGTA